MKRHPPFIGALVISHHATLSVSFNVTRSHPTYHAHHWFPQHTKTRLLTQLSQAHHALPPHHTLYVVLPDHYFLTHLQQGHHLSSAEQKRLCTQRDTTSASNKQHATHTSVLSINKHTSLIVQQLCHASIIEKLASVCTSRHILTASASHALLGCHHTTQQFSCPTLIWLAHSWGLTLACVTPDTIIWSASQQPHKNLERSVRHLYYSWLSAAPTCLQTAPQYYSKNHDITPWHSALMTLCPTVSPMSTQKIRSQWPKDRLLGIHMQMAWGALQTPYQT